MGLLTTFKHHPWYWPKDYKPETCEYCKWCWACFADCMLCNNFPCCHCMPFTCVPYSQTGLHYELEKTFHGTKLQEMKVIGDSNMKKCIAMAVCRTFEDGIPEPDKLKIFDSENKNQSFFSVTEILKATSDAPIFFKNPTQIDGKNYIDGGITGNCPLSLALPRAEEIFSDKEIGFVLSLAPPSTKKSTLKSYGLSSLVFWIASYFTSSMTDGESIFLECKKKYKNATFMRAKTYSEKASEFKLDEKDVKAMEGAVKVERIDTPVYFNKVLDVATVMLMLISPPNNNDFDKFKNQIEMLQTITLDMVTRNQYNECIVVAKKAIDIIPKGKYLYTHSVF